MRVLILAAGYGTRLYPITIHTPKTLITIKGKFLLDFIIDKIERLQSDFPIDEVIIVTNNRFYRNFVEWNNTRGQHVTILNDGSNNPQDRLGAMGDIDFVLQGRGRDGWLIIGSDNFFDWELSDFVQWAVRKQPYVSVGVYTLADTSLLTHFGVVTLDADGKVLDCIEKPQEPQSNQIGVCIYYFPAESLEYLNRFLKETDTRDTTGKYIEWLKAQTAVYGYVFQGNWVDVGHKESLEAVRKLL